MADDQLRTLRRLMKRYHIQFRPPSNEVPGNHADTFDNIKKLGTYQFDAYSAGVSIWSSKEPWKQQMKARVEWLCQRAERLFGQERNEAGWRFGLENHILGRFSVEVACYEIGTNPLFDDRAQEFVVYDELLRSQLPKQGPDRVLGLQKSRNFDSLLRSPIRHEIAKNPDDTISDILKISPFKSEADPLLFPFLLLEAKSETSSCGFDAIQVQSAFPIYALLKLQEELRSCVDWQSGEERFEPLVWFFASRGDQWRVYASHLDTAADGKPTNYCITLLWSGSLLHKDNALQLLLIVDYIMDWARDIYRVAILKQLQSLITGQAIDEISIVDSEVFSMHRVVSNWIPAPSSTIFDGIEGPGEFLDGEARLQMSLDHRELLGVQIPNTKLGSIRSASVVDSRFACFYLTQRLIPSFLEIIGGRYENKNNTFKAARHIINFITQFDEVLVMSGEDLELLEQLWTGTARSYTEDWEDEFYVVLECGWYFTRSWQMTRQLSCFAISKSAFDTMKTHASFSVRRKVIENLHQRERRCPRQVLQQCVECLRAGSSWQVLLAAISSTLVTIYPLPVRRREDFTPPVDVLGLGYVRKDRVKTFILKYLKRDLWKPRRLVGYTDKELRAALRQGYTQKEFIAAKAGKYPKDTTDMSWKRISEQRTHLIDEEAHDIDLCGRCRQKPETTMSPFAHGFLDTRNQPLLSDYGTVLVMSLADPAGRNSPDACVFALRPINDLKDNLALSTMVEDLMQGAHIYHTTKCDVSEIKQCTMMDYNLPLPYRTADANMELRLLNWIRELRDEPLLDKEDHPGYKAWAQEKYNPYIFMFYLSIGHLEYDSLLLAKKAQPQVYYVDSFIFRIKEKNGKDLPWGIDPHRTLKLCGDDLAPRFNTWGDGLDFLGKEYPKQAEELSSLDLP
ncbi:hypothetical protein AAWM_10205 [Aspergillus awamori]|uniref:Uncharacterized protein n=1 Tax=Aspergillus awamori TaxID=105351 RepID=A0A401L759_ASPAW|nr:hypothetical protein AAWM_10205 [Aspergillus awamori]GKZ59436.1 hypothetical protein AnigIFM49718_005315 [Aspergillus niger]GKZ66676.1 hypothetical protein AnigIFM50267_000544 [Aspergillus niger]